MPLPIPIPLLVTIAAFLAGAIGAPILIPAYHRLIIWVYRRTGLMLPDNPVIEGDIVAVFKALVPLLLEQALAGKLDPQALIKAIEDAIAAAPPAKAPALRDLLADVKGKLGLGGSLPVHRP